jgi:thiol-disulfide isomerase/thioredoxin
MPSVTRALLLICAIASVSCSKASSRKEAPAVHTRAATREPRTVVLPALHHGLAWYNDALEPALAQARTEGKLVLVDLWAPWCHTCLSMREYVLTADNLAGVRDRLVFAALDTERGENAPWLAKLPIAAWPTFYVVDADSKVHGRWVGAASAAQLHGMLRDVLRTYDGEQAGKASADDPFTQLAEGDRFAVRASWAEARERYERALSLAPGAWPRTPDTLVSLASALRKLDQPEACVDLGLRHMNDTGSSASATDFAAHVLGCADALRPVDPRVKVARQAAERRLMALCFEGSPALTPDDRGDACGLLRDVREKQNDARGSRAATRQRLSVLEAAARGLPDAIALTYDFARVESLLALDRVDEALALLQARERALPGDYNPPHYLARTYLKLGRHAEGLSAVERALAKAYGPRRAGILGVQVDLLILAGRTADAKRALEAQLAAYRELPVGQKQTARETAVAERLAAWR